MSVFSQMLSVSLGTTRNTPLSFSLYDLHHNRKFPPSKKKIHIKNDKVCKSLYQDQTVSLPLPEHQPEHLSSARSPPLTAHSHQKMPSYSPSLPEHGPCVYGKKGLGFYLDIEHFSDINTDVQTDGLVSQQKSKFSVFKSDK